MFLQCFLLIAIFYCHCVESQIDPITQQSIDGLISDYFLPENRAPALGLAIVTGDGRTLYTKGYGYRNYENFLSANNDTLFLIGSISKSFAATVVVKTLNERFPELGEQALDTPIRQLFPSYNFTLIDRYRSESGTFRDILSHRSCVSPESIGTLLGAFEDIHEFAYRLRYAENICNFRSEFVYNNGHYALAGDIISSISGKPFTQMLDELFTSIGMNQTTYVKETDDHDTMENRSRAYYIRNGTQEKYNSELFKRVIPPLAAGGIISSPSDMAKYMQFHLNLGKVGNVLIVPEEPIKWLHRSNMVLQPRFKSTPGEIVDTNLAYGLGLNIGTVDGWLKLSHGGYITPFHSLMTLIPDLNVGIFTTTNGPGRLPVNTSPEMLHVDILRILQGSKEKTQVSRFQSKPVNIPQPKKAKAMSLSFTKPTLEYFHDRKLTVMQGNAAVGQYGNPLSGELNISQSTGPSGDLQFYMQYGKWGRAWLYFASSSNVSYSLSWDPVYSDVLQDALIDDGKEQWEVTLTFVNGNRLILSEPDFGDLEFIKDQKLEDLPSQPWSPGSCGPDMHI